jgi:hypothetical protein
VSGIAGGISEKVPILSAIAKPVSFVADLVGGVASIFGFSKPLSDSPAERVNVSTDHQALTTDGVSQAQPMSCLTNHKIQLLPGFDGSDEDQMSFAYILKKPAFYQNFAWNGVSPADTVLWNTRVFPSQFFTQTLIDGVSYQDMVPLAFVSKFFKFWSGGFYFHIKFIKTEFHIGRVQVMFVPSYAVNTTSLANSLFAIKAIVDLKERDEVHIHVPYMSVQPWLEDFVSMGNLIISVISPLQTAAAVSANIDVLVEVSGDEDMCFGALTEARTTATIFETAALSAPPSGEFVMAEAEIDSSFDDRTEVIELGGASSIYDSGAKHAFAMGEAVTSLRQLLKRRSRVWGYPANDDENTLSTIFRPYSFGGNVHTIGTGITFRSYFSADYLSCFAPCFLLNRGTIQLFFTGQTLQINRPVQVSVGTAITNSAVVQYSNAPLQYGHGTLCETVGQYNGGITVSLPAWQNTHSCINRMTYEDSMIESDDRFERKTSLIISHDIPRAKAYMQVYRAAGDDFSFGFFIGVPRMSVTITPLSYFPEQ